jgi:FAD/FMN-containing dehydrogenase
MNDTLPGRAFRRGDAGYESARCGAVINGRKPQRFPDIIVQVASDHDVVAAVRYAKSRNMKIAVRSGGHSWAGAFIRDGGMLIDLSQMRKFSIDVGARTASVQPGLIDSDLNRALRQYDLFFPTGHRRTVGLGGFLLQGGFGWSSRTLGPACASVIAIEAVTANGELVRADLKTNSDLLWAARGAGPGFFGVVARFHLALHPRPKAFFEERLCVPDRSL